MMDWLGRRYYRTVFPDQFVERLNPRRRAIRKIQARAGDRLAGIYVRLAETEELSPEETYHLIVWTIAASKYVSEADFSRFVYEVHKPLVDAINSVNGIEVVSNNPQSDLYFNLKDLKQLDLFDLDLDLEYQNRDR